MIYYRFFFHTIGLHLKTTTTKLHIFCEFTETFYSPVISHISCNLSHADTFILFTTAAFYRKLRNTVEIALLFLIFRDSMCS